MTEPELCYTYESKLRAIRSRKSEIDEIKKQSNQILMQEVSLHNEDPYDDGDGLNQSSCFMNCGLFKPRRRKKIPSSSSSSAATATSDASATTITNASNACSSSDAFSKAKTRIFGIGSSKNSEYASDNFAIQKLAHAVGAVSEREDFLQMKLEAARQRAKSFFQSGKKQDALMSLKRAKAIEKQLASISATKLALESQMDVAEEIGLNQTIANALQTTAKATKPLTNGLLSKVEKNIDELQDMRDVASDINELFSESNAQQSSNYDHMDDDELMKELEALSSVGDCSKSSEAVVDSATAGADLGLSSSGSAFPSTVACAMPSACTSTPRTQEHAPNAPP
jgi:hypothetical protein